MPTNKDPAAAVTKERTFEGLNAIAAAIEPAEADWTAAWLEIDNKAGVAFETLMVEVTAKLNAAIETHVDEIARITGNSSSTIRQSYAPKEKLDVWFTAPSLQSPSAYLRNVAKYQSFNAQFWQDSERKSAREELFARDAACNQVSQTGAQTPKAAAVSIANDNVPHIYESDGVRSNAGEFGALSPLEVALLANRVLENYDAHFKNRVASTKHFAFVTISTNDSGARVETFNFWPKNRSVHHLESCPLVEVQGEDATPAHEHP